MLICRYIFLVLLFFIFGCGPHPHPYSLEQLRNAEQNAYNAGLAGGYTQEQLDAEKKKSYDEGYNAGLAAGGGGYTQEQLDAEKKKSYDEGYNAGLAAGGGGYTQEQLDAEKKKSYDEGYNRGIREGISTEDYEKLKSRLVKVQAEVRTSKVEKTIELAKQINFFGFDEETGTVPKEVVDHLNEAKRELEQAERKLRSRYQPEKSAEHAANAFRLRTEIVYYSLIRYHYRLGEKYKELGKKDEKQEAYQEAYKIAKQLFKNATEIDSRSRLFNQIAGYLAEIGLDFLSEFPYNLTSAEEIYKTITKYKWQDRSVQKFVNQFEGK